MTENPQFIYDRSEAKRESRDTPSATSLGRAALDLDANLAAGVNKEVVVIKAGSFHPLIDTLDKHRAKFVRDKKWLGPDHVSDFDEYDDPSRVTWSLVDLLHEEEEDVIVSSLRLTKLDKTDECMSLRMAGVENIEDLPDGALTEIRRAEDESALYDLTRLLPPSKKTISTDEYFKSVIKLIGHGIEYTAIEPEADPVWLFATTAGLHKKLNWLGMPNEAIASIRRPTEQTTVLCFVKPREALAYASEHREKYQMTFQSVHKGMSEARRTLFV